MNKLLKKIVVYIIYIILVFSYIVNGYPKKVEAQIAEVVATDGGSMHTIALKSDGTVWAWGNNQYGQLGNGTFRESVDPIQLNGISGVKTITCGNFHAVVLKDDGTVWSWGENANGQLGNGTNARSNVPVNIMSGVKAIATGSDHTIALKNDGTVWTWGYNQYGQLGNGTNIDSNIPVQLSEISGVKAISCGRAHSIALKDDGTISIWGQNDYGQLGNGNNITSNVPIKLSRISGVKTIAGGEYYTVALKDDDTVWSWGNNAKGQLGNGTNTNSNVPVQLNGISGVNAVSCGSSHTIALKNDDTVWSWGNNANGQLGNGTNTSSKVPVQISGISGVKAISTGRFHTIALKNDGTVWSWGTNIVGQLGDGTTESRSTPVEITGSSAVTADKASLEVGYASGDNSTNVTQNVKLPTSGSNGTTIIWSSSNSSVLLSTGIVDRPIYDLVDTTVTLTATITKGLSSDTKTFTATVIKQSQKEFTLNYTAYGNGEVTGNVSQKVNGGSNGTEVTAVADTGYYFVRWSDGLTTASRTDNNVKCDVTVRAIFATVGTYTKFTDIKAGNYHTIALKNDGTVWTWGDNYNGELGNGTNSISDVPVLVKELSGIIAISAGHRYSVALKDDGTVWCWGGNDIGQLGNGTNTDSNIPVRVNGLTGVKAIATGSDHTIVLKNDGAVWSWGGNIFNQLGNGTTTNSNVPVQVSNLSGVKAIAVGQFHSIVLKDDGTVWSWGNNVFGVLGNGSGEGSNIPVKVIGLSGVKTISAGCYHNVVSKNDGTFWCWGSNYNGELGNCTDDNESNVPVQVNGLSGVNSIICAGSDTFVLKNDGTVLSRGDNSNGQLGNGTTIDSTVLVPVIGLSGVKSISGGLLRTVAIKNDGTAWAWGYDGMSTERTTPVQIMDDSASVLDDMVSLEVGYGIGDNSTRVTQNVKLPTIGSNGTTITWNSNNSSVISHTGIVNWPSNDSEDATVTLTAIITKGLISDTKTFKVTVVNSPKEVTLNYTAGGNGKVTGIVSQMVTEGSDGTEVTAVADPGYHFVRWNDGITTASRRDNNAKWNINVSAIFEDQNSIVPLKDNYITSFGVWNNYSVNGDLYVGPNSILNISGNVTIEGDLYVYGQICNYGILTVKGTVYSNGIAHSNSFPLETYDGKIYVVGGENKLEAEKPIIGVKLPLKIYEANDTMINTEDEMLDITSAVIPVVDLYIDNEKINYNYDGTFKLSKDLSAKREITVDTSDKYGNTQSIKYIIKNKTYDFDKDKDVDVLDLAQVASNYNKNNSNESWKSDMDYNDDDIIDIYDIAKICKKIS